MSESQKKNCCKSSERAVSSAQRKNEDITIAKHEHRVKDKFKQFLIGSETCAIDREVVIVFAGKHFFLVLL